MRASGGESLAPFLHTGPVSEEGLEARAPEGRRKGCPPGTGRRRVWPPREPTDKLSSLLRGTEEGPQHLLGHCDASRSGLGGPERCAPRDSPPTATKEPRVLGVRS